MPKTTCTIVVILRCQWQVPRSSPYDPSSVDTWELVQVGGTGHLRWFSIGLQNRKSPPSPSCSCWGKAKWGQVEGLQCQCGIKNIFLTCPFGVHDSGSQHPLRVCLFRLCFPCFANAVPSLPFHSVLHFFYQARCNLFFSIWGQTAHLKRQLLPTDLLTEPGKQSFAEGIFQRSVCLCQNTSADSLVFTSLLN